MEFSLHYRGPLKSNGKPKDKHRLRLDFHRQLKALADSRKVAANFLAGLERDPSGDSSRSGQARTEFVDTIAGWNFLALSSRLEEHHYDSLSLETKHWILAFRGVEPSLRLGITMYRPGVPGQIMSNGGDIDNRLKTLFDALQPPAKTISDLGSSPSGSGSGSDPDPVLCLMKDDAQITDVNVCTRQLFAPENQHEVVLTIDVAVAGYSLLR